MSALIFKHYNGANVFPACIGRALALSTFALALLASGWLDVAPEVMRLAILKSICMETLPQGRCVREKDDQKTWNSPTKKREDKERLWCVPVRLFKLQMSRILISSKLPVAFALFTASMLFSSCGGPLLTLVYCYYCSSFTRRLPRLLFIHSSTHSSLQKKAQTCVIYKPVSPKKNMAKRQKMLEEDRLQA